MRIEISDGDTPLIRLAWPNVFGLIDVNFSIPSADKAVICL